MRQVRCIIHPDQVDAATDAIERLDIVSLSMTPGGVSDGRRKPSFFYRGTEYRTRYLPSVMLDVVVDDCKVDDVIEAVTKSGDGRISPVGQVVISPVESAFTIRFCPRPA